ncbi:MAG: nucleoside-diphosphate sugar epimerase/dehydratase [Gaiellales bacterium]
MRRFSHLRLSNRHQLVQIAVDAGLVAAAWFLAFWFRFEDGLPLGYDRLFDSTIWIVVPIKVAVFVLFGLYSHWWRYVSLRDMWAVLQGAIIATIVAELAVYLIHPVPGFRVPRSVFALDLLFTIGFIAGARLLTRTVLERPGPRGLVARGKEILIVGAGDAGQLIVREMLRSPLAYTPVGLIDDDPRKRHLRLHGIRVLGSTEELPAILEDVKPDEVAVAIPSAAGEVRLRVVTACRDARIPVKTLPSVNELISGDLHLARQLREVQVEDILGREAIRLDLERISSSIAGKTVLVTGAGGSIGSELCRQIAAVGAGRLVLVEHSENALFEIERELLHERGFTAAVPVLADAKNATKLRQVFERYQPAVVFHAAAYKHVPLVEANPIEAVRNNVFATQAVARVSAEHEVETFVLVSTDKAVNPKNVLGQTKLLCEWLVHNAGLRGAGTTFLAVRFGNVLASSGSVIPLFRRQIARGGPVTVTHPEMTRYFMTIPEAAQLIVQAGAIGESGDVFVLDMGEPVKIVDLATNMIRLSGREPGRDIAIEFIGARPGEKLHEELWADGEQAEPTVHPKIFRAGAQNVDPVWLEAQLVELGQLVESGDTLGLVGRLGGIVREPRHLGVAAEEPIS